MFVILFILCIQALLFKDSRLKPAFQIQWPLLVVACVMFAIGTLDIAVGLFHNIHAFVDTAASGKPDEQFQKISNWANVLKLANTLVQCLIGDGMLIYRCWIIFSYSWLVVSFSLVLFFAAAGCCISTLLFASTLQTQTTVNAGKLQPLITSFLACSIALNIITTGLIVYRIWSVDEVNRKMNFVPGWSSSDRPSRTPYNHSSSRLRKAMLIIVESGALYTGTSIITFVAYLSKSNSSYATSDVEVQMAGVAFSLIIIRAASSASDTSMPSGSHNLPLSVRSQPVQIMVRQDVHQSKADAEGQYKSFASTAE